MILVVRIEFLVFCREISCFAGVDSEPVGNFGCAIDRVCGDLLFC